jgi:hypothetical protein
MVTKSQKLSVYSHEKGEDNFENCLPLFHGPHGILRKRFGAPLFFLTEILNDGYRCPELRNLWKPISIHVFVQHYGVMQTSQSPHSC